MKILKNFKIVLFVTALLLFTQTANAALQAVGPVSPQNGYPLWYQDTNGMTVEQCFDTNGLCLFDPALELPNPAAPLSFPGNFPGEMFWWTTETDIVNPSGLDALLVLAMEGAFVGGEVAVPGEQMTFGRIRVRMNVPAAGTYTVTHPFGVNVYQVAAVLPGPEVFDTQDIGCVPVPQANITCDFGLALVSGIGPFLTWDNFAQDPPQLRDPVTGRRYVGDATTSHAITGSPLGTNFFKIEGPANVDLNANIAGIQTTIQTNLFVVSGKVADTIKPVFLGNSTVPSIVEAGRDSFTLSATITDPIDPVLTVSSGAANMTVDLRQLNVPNASMALVSGTAANGTWSVTLSPVSRKIGTFMLPVTGRDGSFNFNTSNILMTLVDTIAPAVVLSDNHPDNIVRDADTVIITASFTEIGSGINETNPPKITIGSIVTNAAMAKVNNTVWNFTWDVPAGNDGTVSVSIVAFDNASLQNTAATGKISYIIDNTPPALTTLLATPPTVEAGFGNSTINATFTDANGVAMVTINLSQIGTTVLQGSQSPTDSPAMGTATFVIDTVANNLSFNIQYSGLLGNETAAHIHGPAAPGVNAGILFTLPPGSPKSGVWTYPEAQEANILAGLTYVNIHTNLFPNGEIRGQIIPVPDLSMMLVSGTTNDGVWKAIILSPNTGTFSLALNATDIAGNSNTAGTVALTAIDTKPPLISLTQTRPDSIIPDGVDSTTLIVNVSDFGAVSAIASVTVDLSQIGGSNTAALTGTGGSTWQLSGVVVPVTLANSLGGTTVHLPVNATDAAGSSNISTSISLGIKKFIPVTAGTTTQFNFLHDSGVILFNGSITAPAGTTLTGQLLGAPVSAPPASPGLKQAGTAMNLTNLTFDRPITIGMEFNPAAFADTANESKLRLWFFNTTAGKWEMTANSAADVQNRTVSGDAGSVGMFAPLADLTPPVISNIAETSVTINSAMITWTTDEFSQSFVNFGTTSGVYTNTTNVSGGTSHSTQLTGLVISTTYFYTVNSTDLTGNSANSAEKSFTTNSPPAITGFAPLSPFSDSTGSFNITIDQIANVTWLINGTTVQTNISVTAARYTNSSARIGMLNVGAEVSNANGSVMQTWIWNVTSRIADAQVAVYDINNDGIIHKLEAVRAVLDFFTGTIQKSQAVAVVVAFFTTQV